MENIDFDSFVSFFVSTVDRNEGIVRLTFSFKIMLLSPWYNHISSTVDMMFI